MTPSPFRSWTQVLAYPLVTAAINRKKIVIMYFFIVLLLMNIWRFDRPP
jgi:hypothetical protein